MSPAFWPECFKGLGGSYAAGKYLADKLQCDINSLSFAALTLLRLKKKLKIVFFATATDGNHGRGVAWAAEQLGLKAVVYMPKGSSLIWQRIFAIMELNAPSPIWNYDDAVRLAHRMAQTKAGCFAGYSLDRV